MCEMVEEMIDNEKKEIVLRLLARGRLSFEEIAEDTGLTLEQVEELAKVQLV